MTLHKWKLVDDKAIPAYGEVYCCSRCGIDAFKENGKYYSELISSYLFPNEDAIVNQQYLINVDCDFCIVASVVNS